MVREPYHSERERADVADAEPAALGGSHGTVVKREASHARLPLSSFRPLYIAGVRVSRDHFLPPDPRPSSAPSPSPGRVSSSAPPRPPSQPSARPWGRTSTPPPGRAP